MQDSTNLGVLPPQKKTSRQKTKAWKEECVDAICAKGYFRYNDNRSIREDKVLNYNMLKGYISDSDYKYVLNPYDKPDQQVYSPAEIRNYNIIYNKFSHLIGRASQRPLNYRAVAVKGEAVTETDEFMKKELLANLQDMLMNELSPEVDEMGNPIQPPSPKEVKEEVMRSFKSIAEVTANDLLEFLSRMLDLKDKFLSGFKHALVAGEEIYYIGTLAGKPHVRPVNPVYFEFDRSPEQKNIEDSHWAREDRFMSPSQILDEYGEFLSESEIDRIDKFRVGRQDVAHFPGYASRSSVNDYYNDDSFENTNFIVVSVCTWKSMKKIGFLSYRNVIGQPQEEIIFDDTRKLTDEEKELGFKLEWKWVTEVWEGTKIGSDIYANIRPLPYQLHEFDYGDAKLPYVGTLYNSINTKSTSWVDLVAPHQVLYNIVMFRLELEIAKAKGKKFVMDLAQLPKTEGLDLERWLEYFDNAGIAFINSAEEGREDQMMQQGSAAKFNQYQAIDMTLSQSVGQYISILTKIEDMVDSLSGINRQTEGQTFASETATGVQKSITQSSYNIEPYFYLHENTIGRVLTQLVNLSAYLFEDGEQIKFVTDDLGIKFLRINADKLKLSDIAVFISNSATDIQQLEELKQASMAALQAGNSSLSQITDVFLSKSISQVKDVMRKIEKEEEARQQQAQKMRQQEMQAAQKMEQEKLDREDRNKQLDREADIQVATIRAMGFSNDADVNNNQIPDITEQEKVAREQVESSFNKLAKIRELGQADRKADIEEKKIETDFKIAKENENKYDQDDGDGLK